MAKRDYKAKDVNLLLAAKTITRFYTEHQPELAIINVKFTPEYGVELESRIDNSLLLLGEDKQKPLREATKTLMALMGLAKKKIALLKTLITSYFPNEKHELLNLYGYTSYMELIHNNDQEALIQLLYTIKSNLSAEHELAFTNKGVNPSLFAELRDLAGQITLANRNQEVLKEETKESSTNAVKIFNGIYHDIITICKMGAIIFANDPVIKEKFTFSKVVANMNNNKSPHENQSNASPEETIIE